MSRPRRVFPVRTLLRVPSCPSGAGRLGLTVHTTRLGVGQTNRAHVCARMLTSTLLNTAVSMCSWDSMSQHVSTQYWIVRLVPLWRFQLCSLLLLRVMVPKTGVRLTWAFHLWEPWIRLQSLWASVDAASIPSPLESRPLAILVGSSPRWDVGLARVSPTDVHILSYHSDVSVVSENGEDNIVEFEIIARNQEWQQIAMAVTIDLSNEHFIRFI